MSILQILMLYNEYNYFQQSKEFQMLQVMKIAFGAVMAGKKQQNKVKSNEKKLKPKRIWRYEDIVINEEDIKENIKGMEKFFKEKGGNKE